MDPEVLQLLKYCAAVLLGGTLVFFLVRFLTDSASQERAHEQFLNEFQAMGREGPLGARVLEHAGVPVWVEYEHSRAGQSLNCSVDFAGGPVFGVYTKDSTDSFLQKTGLSGAVITGDPEFDKRFKIDSDQLEAAGAFLALPERRRAIAALFEEGCWRINSKNGRLYAKRHISGTGQGKDAGLIQRVLPHMAALAGASPATGGSAPAPVQPGAVPPAAPEGLTFDKYFSYSLRTLPVLFVLLVVFVNLAPQLTGQLFSDTIKLSLPALAVFLLWTGTKLKGKSWFLGAMLWTTALAAAFIPLTFFTVGAMVNRLLDTGQPVTRELRILSKKDESSRHHPSYKLFVSSLDGTGTLALSAGRREYEQAVPGRTLAAVTIRPGKLGYGYIAGVRYTTPPAAPARTSPPERNSAAVPNAADYVARARAAYNNKDYDKAIAYLSQAIQLDPAQLQLYRMRAAPRGLTADYDGVIEDISRFLAGRPGDPDAYSVRGNAWLKLGETGEAIADFTKAIALAPSDPGHYFLRAMAYRESGMRAKEAADMKKYQDLSKK